VDGWINGWMDDRMDGWMDDKLSFLPLIAVATEVVWLYAVLFMWEKWHYEKKPEAAVTHREMHERQAAFCVVSGT